MLERALLEYWRLVLGRSPAAYEINSDHLELPPTMLGQEFVVLICYTVLMANPISLEFLRPPTIHRKEWWLAVVVAVVAAGWSLWPTITGLRQAPAGQQYLYSNIPDTSDTQIYYAFIDQNARGHVVYKNLFTSEPQKAVLFNPLWLTLGTIERLTGYPADVVFTSARVLGGLLLVMAIFYVISHFFQQPRWRWITFLAAVFGGGLGGLLLLIHHSDPRLVWIQTQTPILRSLPSDLTYAISFTWLTISHSPLFELGQLLLLGSWMILWRGGRLLWVAVLVGVLAFIHPYDPVLFFGIIAGHVVFGILSNQMTPELVRRYLRAAALLSLALLPAAIYYLWAIITEPVIHQWFSQNILYSPPLTSLLAGFGAMSLFAFIGAQRAIRQPGPGLLVTAWAVTGTMLPYVPFIPFQAKMLSLLSVPVSMLAVMGAQRLSRTAWWTKRRFLLVATLTASVTITFSTVIFFPLRISRAQPIEPIYHYAPTDLLDTLRWIDAHTPPNAVILGDYASGNLVPQYANRQTYVGHNIQTIHYLQKLTLVRNWFYATNSDRQQKQHFLEDNHITYIMWGPNEKRLGSFQPSALPGLILAYQHHDISVYRVLGG